MIVAAMSEGTMWTIIIIVLIVFVFGVVIITDDFDWFD
jgi:hypothetical protein